MESTEVGWDADRLCEGFSDTCGQNPLWPGMVLEPGWYITCTFTNKAKDTDGDGIADFIEGQGDRDGDGVPNHEDYDPTGYFYDEATGRILKGGSISVNPAGPVNQGNCIWTYCAPRPRLGVVLRRELS